MERDQFYISLLSYPKFNGIIDFEETVIITRVSVIMINIIACFHVCKWSISFMTMKH